MNVTHEINREKTTTTWITPLPIIQALGEFDLDPCTPDIMPWATAKKRYTEKDNGLIQPWHGRVWLNPPYGKGMEKWMQKMAAHNHGIALLFNRSETECFHDWVWSCASAILFKKGRIHFLNECGEKVGNGSGTGSVLVAYGKEDAIRLRESGINGKYIDLA